MDTRIQIGEEVALRYRDAKWECGQWYHRQEIGEIVSINKEYFTVHTTSGLEVEYYNDTLKEKTRYGYEVYFSTLPNTYFARKIDERLMKLEKELSTNIQARHEGFVQLTELKRALSKSIIDCNYNEARTIIDCISKMKQIAQICDS